MGFNVIDQMIVGLLGADAVAAVGLSNSIASIALLLYASAGVGAGVMVARAFGRKDLKEVSQIASTGQGLSGLLGLITAFLLISFSQPLLRLVGADPKLAGSANGYFQLYAGSIAPMILSAVTSAVFRSLNAPRTPLIITSAAVALNTVLGFVLVLGFGPIPSFGVTGAGWATLLSQSGRCLALILFLYCSKKGVRWVWPLPGSKVGTTAGKLLRLTGPIAISEVLWGMSTFIYAVVFTRLGTTKLAASQIVLSLESIFICCIRGLGSRCRGGHRTRAGSGLADSCQGERVAHDPVWPLGRPRAWHALRGVELSTPRVIPKSGSRRPSAGFLGRSPDGRNATGQGLKQRARQRRAGQRRRYTLCAGGQLGRNLRSWLASRDRVRPTRPVWVLRGVRRQSPGRGRQGSMLFAPVPSCPLVRARP